MIQSYNSKLPSLQTKIDSCSCPTPADCLITGLSLAQKTKKACVGLPTQALIARTQLP
jgi:hypothetical protein